MGIARGSRLPPTRGLRAALGLYEVEIARHIRAFVDNDDVCFDVGAGHGYYSLALAKLATSGRVFSFEPEAGCYADLVRTLGRNRVLARRITAVPLALAARPATGATTIDAFVDEQARPTMMKIDVDGPEFGILQGAARTLEHHKPRLVIETHGYEVEANCLQLIASAGYGYRVIDAQRLWPEVRPIEVNRWVIAVHRSDPKARFVIQSRRQAGRMYRADRHPGPEVSTEYTAAT